MFKKMANGNIFINMQTCSIAGRLGTKFCLNSSRFVCIHIYTYIGVLFHLLDFTRRDIGLDGLQILLCGLDVGAFDIVSINVSDIEIYWCSLVEINT